MKNFVALLVGLLFGAGLTISQMVDPNKVLNFLDIAGSWDASLMFVMGSGLLTYMIGYQLFIKRAIKPKLAASFDLPKQSKIDKKLLIGSSIFGIGWGISGMCPGPALANLSGVNAKVLAFIFCMIIGIIAAKFIGDKVTK